MKTVVLVAFEGVQMLDVVGPSDVFGKVEQLRSGSYQLVVASPIGGEVRSNSGLVLSRTISLAELSGSIDTVLIAGSDEAGLRSVINDTGLVDWIKRAKASGACRVGSVCTGAFVLAAAGLLEGKRATTHWSSCAELARLCPSTLIEAASIYTVDPPIYTSAGVTAGIDLALAMVEEDFGRAIAAEVARELVLFLRRPSRQPQLSAGLVAQTSTSNRLQDLITWIVDNPAADLSVNTLADRAGMSERNLARVFRHQTGATLSRFVEQTRLEHSRDLLENSDWSLDRIAERAGFGSIDAFRSAFRRRYQSTPGEYRNTLT